MVVALVTAEQLTALDAVAARLDAKGLHEESQALREVLAQVRPQMDEVPASAAAEILYVAPDIIERWVDTALLAGRRDARGRVWVKVEALEPAIGMRQALPDVADATYSDAEIDAEIEHVRAKLRAARAH